MKKQFIGTCVENPFDEKGIEVLVNVVENYPKEITRATFFKNCYLDEDLKRQIKQYPGDFTFHKSRTFLRGGQIVYFYQWSAIEHFYT